MKHHPRVSRRDVLIMDASESTTGSDYNINVLPDDVLRSIISYSSPSDCDEIELVNKRFHRSTLWVTSSWSSWSMKKLQVLLPTKDYNDNEVLTLDFIWDFFDKALKIGQRCIYTGEIQCLMAVLFLHTTYSSNLPVPVGALGRLAHEKWSQLIIHLQIHSDYAFFFWKTRKKQRKLKVSMYSTATDFTKKLLSIKSETKRCDFAFDNGYTHFAYWLHKEYGYEWKNA